MLGGLVLEDLYCMTTTCRKDRRTVYSSPFVSLMPSRQLLYSFINFVYQITPCPSCSPWFLELSKCLQVIQLVQKFTLPSSVPLPISTMLFLTFKARNLLSIYRHHFVQDLRHHSPDDYFLDCSEHSNYLLSYMLFLFPLSHSAEYLMLIMTPQLSYSYLVSQFFLPSLQLECR